MKQISRSNIETNRILNGPSTKTIKRIEYTKTTIIPEDSLPEMIPEVKWIKHYTTSLR